MTVVDWLIVLFTVLLAVHGYMRGFVVGALSLVGFALGGLIGTRLGPLLLTQGDHSPYAPLFGLGGALLAGGVLATGFEGFGRHARAIFRVPGLRLLDGLLGAVVLQTPGSIQLRRDVQRSTILKELNQILPPSGPILNALSRVDPLPAVAGPPANVPAPTRGILAAAGVRSASRSVVKIVGSACGLGIEGSGWVAGPGLVVTNAHVVAGESDTTVQLLGTGPALPATPIVFDVHNDIAVLRVPGLTAPVLRLAPAPRTGTAAAILGFPLDGSFNEQPGRLGATQETSTENAYGQGPVIRLISSLRGLVRPGNSGGPMVDGAGQVLATVFAAITDAPRGQSGGFAVPDSVVASELARARARPGRVSSGSCAE